MYECARSVLFFARWSGTVCVEHSPDFFPHTFTSALGMRDFEVRPCIIFPLSMEVMSYSFLCVRVTAALFSPFSVRRRFLFSSTRF